jgi:iron complex transport system permease protein
MSTQEETTVTAERASFSSLALAFAGLLWMAGLLWSARATITGRTDVYMEVTSTAYAMPGAISASLVAGAAVGLTVVGLVTRRRALGATARFAVATGAGLILGLLGALVMLTINTEGWVYAVVAGSIAAAATIGGALGGIRPPRLVAAVCWAAITVFLLGVLLTFAQGVLFGMFGAGDSPSSQVGAANWYSLTQAVVSGIVAGVLVHRLLRGSEVRWVWIAVAGAGPGLLQVVGEILTRTAGARVLDLAGKVSALEKTVQQMLSGARLNSAMIILFVGAITAAIAVGRTLKPASPPATPAAAPASSSEDVE